MCQFRRPHASQSVVPAGRRAPTGSLSPTKAGRHRDLLPAPLTLRLGSEGALGGGRQHAARVLRDDHEPPERHDRAAPHEPSLAHHLLLIALVARRAQLPPDACPAGASSAPMPYFAALASSTHTRLSRSNS